MLQNTDGISKHRLSPYYYLLLFITPKQHDIQTIDITILHIKNTNRANIKHKT